MSAGVALFLLLIGLLHLFFPRASWYMSVGWKIRDAEPSDLYLGLSRFGGGLLAVISVIVLIVSMVQAHEHASHQMDKWNAFQREMTVQNISSISGFPGDTPSATPKEISEFVQDIHAVTGVSSTGSSTNQGGSFSAYGTYQIICKDGYQAQLIDINQSGTFGIATSSAWLVPDYEFLSGSLSSWETELTASQNP